jgi:glycosyltransferase involved in cell wall biosynthesis
MPYSPHKQAGDALTLRPQPKLSVVVPCFNEEETLPLLLGGISKLNDTLIETAQISEPLTLVLVDDGSSDNTWSLISEAKASFNIQGVKLSRNSGHQSALLAGLMHSKGDIMISMDADLQDDPMASIQMVERFRQGDEIVFGVRGSRETDTVFKRTSARWYYSLLSVFGVELIPNHADYRLMSVKARDALAKFGESNLYLRGLVHKLGFQTSIVTYDRAARVAGESKYNFRRMISLAIDGVTSFSVRPLRFITVFGFCVASISIFAILYAWVAWIAGAVVPGWTSIVLPIYFLGGAHLVALGIIGEYIGKIYTETKSRPQFIIDRETHTVAQIESREE